MEQIHRASNDRLANDSDSRLPSEALEKTQSDNERIPEQNQLVGQLHFQQPRQVVLQLWHRLEIQIGAVLHINRVGLFRGDFSNLRVHILQLVPQKHPKKHQPAAKKNGKPIQPIPQITPVHSAAALERVADHLRQFLAQQQENAKTPQDSWKGPDPRVVNRGLRGANVRCLLDKTRLRKIEFHPQLHQKVNFRVVEIRLRPQGGRLVVHPICAPQFFKFLNKFRWGVVGGFFRQQKPRRERVAPPTRRQT